MLLTRSPENDGGAASRAGIPQSITDYNDENYEYIYTLKYRRSEGKNLKSEKATRLCFYYRGVSNNSHLIEPGIYRSTEKHQENYYFNEISVRCPDAFRSFNNLEKLTYMQHYGCPTRLLDITANPLVALYFSCLGNQKKDGVVYVFAISESDVLYSNSDRVQMLSKLAEFNQTDQKKLRYYAYRYLLNDSFPCSTSRKYRNQIIEQYYHSIKRNNSAFEREIVPFDMLKPLFVQPNKDNPRILKQDGAFIISGLDQNGIESDFKIRKFIVNEMIIESNSKNSILRDLEYIGINQATLFPEVEKVADYLRKKN